MRPSVNQAERAIRMTAEMYQTEYPLLYGIILHMLIAYLGRGLMNKGGNASEDIQLCLGKAL